MSSSRSIRVLEHTKTLLESCATSSSLVCTRHVSKRTKRGLFAGKRVLSGNNVSEDGGNRTRRVWKPNAHNASLYSDILDRKVRFKVTPSALRNIDKAGGLDNYLLYSKDRDVDSERGARVKMELLNTLRLQYKS